MRIVRGKHSPTRRSPLEPLKRVGNPSETMQPLIKLGASGPASGQHGSASNSAESQATAEERFPRGQGVASSHLVTPAI